MLESLIHPTDEYVITVCENTQWCLWDISKRKMVSMISENIPLKHYTSGGLHPDGLLLGVGTSESIVQLFDNRAAGREVARLNCKSSTNSTEPIRSLDFNENGYLVVTVSGNQAKIWDLRKLERINQINQAEPLLSSRFDSSGNFLAVGSSSVNLYSVKQNYAVVKNLHDPNKRHIQAICLGKGASFVAFVGENHILTLYTASL